MPLAVDNLNKESSMNTIREAINQSFETCMKEPAKKGESTKDQQSRCGSMIYSIAREKTGKQLKQT
jgi:septin family protein